MNKDVKKRQWSEADLALAVNAVRSATLGLNEAGRRYNVPKATLRRHMNGQNKGRPLVKSFGRTPVFTKAMEKELESHILKFEERMFGLIIKDVRKLAFDVAKMHGLGHWFNEEKGLAGKKWFYKFMKRNPRLSLRQPEATSLARMKGFSKEKVGEFF
ncbi:hypothetical protein NQ314_002471 [Rhamnusium bicolor]|uniref:HTH psq-type domain-containing protein n=1 Tax=Rhamnusium bicolor TaxID=1586634 RepID=A0AAV8ZRA1_9CUCU|nr:hypothetical protein NQ314_002471 [Rhamnusium bicolor]